MKERGSAFVEFTMIAGVGLLLISAIIDLDLWLSASTTVTYSTRDAARTAAALPDLTEDDVRIKDLLTQRLTEIAGVTFDPNQLTVTAPTSVSGLLSGVTGAECDRRVTVGVTATYNSFLLRVFGMGSFPISRNISMRHHNGELCD